MLGLSTPVSELNIERLRGIVVAKCLGPIVSSASIQVRPNMEARLVPSWMRIALLDIDRRDNLGTHPDLLRTRLHHRAHVIRIEHIMYALPVEGQRHISHIVTPVTRVTLIRIGDSRPENGDVQ